MTDPEWRTLLNEAVLSAWRMAAAARPDFQVTSQDFTITSGVSASFAVPANFFDVVDVVWSPDTTSEYSLGPFAWQNRRSPGGWFPANFGVLNTGGSSARLMGSNIYIEPSLRAGGIYRLWFCPAPKLVRADLTVVVATAGALPAYSSSLSGLSHTLTGSVNGFLTIDGVTFTAGDIGKLVLVQSQIGIPAGDNGVYSIVDPGSGGTPWILRRSTISPQSLPGVSLMVQASSGTTNVDLFFESTTSATGFVIDTTPWLWAEAFIEPALEQFAELLRLMTAIPAMQRDDDLDPRPLIARAYGADGTGGLAGEMKSYFRQVRTASGPSKMVDTDRRGPWIGGGW